jgi:hypothetical protein
MIVASIPLENYQLEIDIWFASPTLSAILPHCGMDVLVNWSKSQSKSIELSWWSVLMFVLVLIPLIVLSLISHPLSLSFRLFVDSDFIGYLYLQKIRSSSSFQEVQLTCSLEIDCELLVSISQLTLHCSLSEISLLFWTKFCSSQPQTRQTSIGLTLSDWATISLDKLSSSDETFLSDHSCYQYLHPQITLLSHLTLSETKAFTWALQETADRTLLRQHASLFFSKMKANANLFTSKSSLSSPSLHLFMISLTSPS